MPLLRNADLLRPFLAVARKGNLSAAAREMSVSQPALTKSVRKLEQLSARRYHAEIKLDAAEQVDAQVMTWVARAYALALPD